MDPETALHACTEDLREGKSYSGCTTAFMVMVVAYGATGDDEGYDLISRFIGATVPEYRKNKRKNYLGDMRAALGYAALIQPALAKDADS